MDLIGIEPMTSSMPWKRAPSCATGPHRRGYTYCRLRPLIRQTLLPLATADREAASSLLRMRVLFRITPIIFALSFAVPTPGQAVPEAQSAAPHPSAILQAALSDIQSSTSDLNVAKWKAPGSVRDAAQQNVDSIQRDLGNTLPTLLAQADAAPESVPLSFAVYRNIDALYDVLLRVSETADLAAPSSEAESVTSCLQKLEAARAQLADSIVHAAQGREAKIVALEAAQRAAKPAPEPERSETVIDDGPATTVPKKSKKKAVPKKATPKPAAAAPAAAPSK